MMILDSHEHVMLPTDLQLQKMKEAGVDKAILFATTPHVEKAKSATLQDIGREMQALYRLLGGGYPLQKRIEQMKDTIAELQQAIAAEPGKFLGFGAVPLGLSNLETSEWLERTIVQNGFRGVGEFTPGSEPQVEQLRAVFRAVSDYPEFPVWVHTFDPVMRSGLQILMRLCEEHPAVPVIFGHMGGYNWMDVIAFAKEQPNVYLDLSASFTPLSVKTALTEAPERCLFGSDAPFGEPKLTRQLIEFVSPSAAVTDMALGENAARLLRL